MYYTTAFILQCEQMRHPFCRYIFFFISTFSYKIKTTELYDVAVASTSFRSLIRRLLITVLMKCKIFQMELVNHRTKFYFPPFFRYSTKHFFFIQSIAKLKSRHEWLKNLFWKYDCHILKFVRTSPKANSIWVNITFLIWVITQL